MRRKAIGIIGGMGPKATIDFMEKILINTPAKDDEDHLHMIVDNNPQIPSRVKAIFEDGESPGPTMVEIAKKLENYGSELIAIPCNTAHYYIEEIIRAVDIPVLNIVEETVEELLRNNIQKVMLLASTAVLEIKLYDEMLKKAGIEGILPDQACQKIIMEAIFDVKAGNIEIAKEKMHGVLTKISQKGVKAVILGCTELPIIVDELNIDNLHFFDTSNILAKAVVKKALNM